MPTILEVAIPCPLRQTFDYLVSTQAIAWQPGLRVKVTFGSRQVVGIVCAVHQNRPVPSKLKTILTCLDKVPLLSADLFKLVIWLSQYYHHPIGECFQAALPKRLRQGDEATIQQITLWSASQAETAIKGKKQQQLLSYLQHSEQGYDEKHLRQQFGQVKTSLKALEKSAWIKSNSIADCLIAIAKKSHSKHLNAQQKIAFEQINIQLESFHPFLLQGVTGSGKTELYLQLSREQINRGKQVLILIPEIGLTNQFVERFQRGLNAKLALSHSAISDKQRQQSWLLAKNGLVDIVIGTRSAIFTPMQRPGLIIIDEEHDASYKQQDGLRYHARNIALLRARNFNIPIVLGSATPSLESLYQVQQQRMTLLTLTHRAGQAKLPKVELLDCHALTTADQGISPRLITAINEHIQQQQQVLLFINRRGFAPVLMCHQCDWQATCRSCDAKMVVHQQRNVLYCHHCGLIQRLPTHCPDCGDKELNDYGLGTEKVEQFLQQRFPKTPVLRIDRDTTQRVNAFAEMVEFIQQGQPTILVGTQMLAKGHDFQAVTLVGIVDADQGLFSADFRATEVLSQSITQVTGRAGRGDKPGNVFIQTQQPHHPFWQQLLDKGYAETAAALLDERIEMALPPKGYWAVWRAEAIEQGAALQLLTLLLEKMPESDDVNLMGPMPALMEKRAGRYRAQLLLSSAKRSALHAFIDHCLPLLQQLKLARKVRWSIDIDPTEFF